MSLLSRQATAVVFNPKPKPIARMLDFDFLCGRETPSVAALVTPGAEPGNHKVFFGQSEIFIPIYPSIVAATAAHPEANIFLNFASQRRCVVAHLLAARGACRSSAGELTLCACVFLLALTSRPCKRWSNPL